MSGLKEIVKKPVREGHQQKVDADLSLLERLPYKKLLP